MAQWALGVLNRLVNESNHGRNERCGHCPLEKNNNHFIVQGGLEEGMGRALAKVGRDRKELELLGAGAEGSWFAAFRTSQSPTPSACPALGILSLLLLSH